MKFGVREVMVVAALAFGIVAAGCTTHFRTNLAMEPHLKAMNSAQSEHLICMADREFEFFYPDIEPTLRDYDPEVSESSITSESTALAGGPGAGMPEYARSASKWAPSLPSFLK